MKSGEWDELRELNGRHVPERAVDLAGEDDHSERCNKSACESGQVDLRPISQNFFDGMDGTETFVLSANWNLRGSMILHRQDELDF